MTDQPRTAARWTIFAAALSLLLLAACAARGPGQPTPTPWPTPIVAEKPAYTVTRGTVADTFELSGQVVPAVWELLHFPVDGRLALLDVAEGSQVREGQVLAELEMKGLQEQLAQAQLSLEQAQDQLAQQERTRGFAIERARLNLRLQEVTLEKLRAPDQSGAPLAVAQAEKELERARLALQKAQAAYDAVAWQPAVGASPQAAALQSATLEYQIAEARYRLQLADREAQIKAQEIQVELARITLQELVAAADETLQRNLAKAQMQVQALERQIEERRLRAPYAGVVVAVGLKLEGLRRGFAQTPRVGDAVPAFAPLVALARPEPLEITVPTTGSRAGELVVGQVVTVTHGAAPDQPFPATVAAIPVRVLGSAQSTQAQVIRIALPPSAPRLTIGDPVAIEVVGQVHADTLFLPPAAVRRFMGHTFVVVEVGGRQRRVDVRLGLENEEQVEILDGLREGDLVIGP